MHAHQIDKVSCLLFLFSCQAARQHWYTFSELFAMVPPRLLLSFVLASPFHFLAAASRSDKSLDVPFRV